jgi:hypothetical protein
MISGSDGLIENDLNIGGMIDSDMFEIIAKYYPKYYNELLDKYKDNDINTYEFEKKLFKEKKEDEERLKLDVDRYKQKYSDLLEENRILSKKVIQAFEEAFSLQKQIGTLKDELGEEKTFLQKGIPML